MNVASKQIEDAWDRISQLLGDGLPEKERKALKIMFYMGWSEAFMVAEKYENILDHEEFCTLLVDCQRQSLLWLKDNQEVKND